MRRNDERETTKPSPAPSLRGKIFGTQPRKTEQSFKQKFFEAISKLLGVLKVYYLAFRQSRFSWETHPMPNLEIASDFLG